MVTRRLYSLAFFVALACVVFSGCAVEAGSSDEPGVVSSGQTSGGAGASESPNRDDFGPPESKLSLGEKRLTGELGGYCWKGPWKGEAFARCTESAGYPITEEALIVPAGSTLTFVYGGMKLDSLNATAHRIGREARFEEIAGTRVLVPTAKRGTRLPVRRSGNRACIASELPAGQYNITFFAQMPQGDAFYGFLVTVE